MKVNIWKNVDIEAEADVSLEDCINELLDTANSDDGPRRKIEAASQAMTVLEKIGPEVLTEMQLDASRTEITRRLQKWIDVLTLKGE